MYLITQGKEYERTFEIGNEYKTVDNLTGDTDNAIYKVISISDGEIRFEIKDQQVCFEKSLKVTDTFLRYLLPKEEADIINDRIKAASDPFHIMS